MPWPFLPPDPDIPSPVATPPGGDWVAFPLTLTGMSPFDEQAAHAFYVDGKRAGVFLDREVAATRHVWSGVCVAKVRARAKFDFKVVYLPQGEVSGFDVRVRPREFAAKVVAAGVSRSGSKAIFSVRASVPGAGEYQVMAVPNVEKLPRYTSPEAYGALAGWAPLNSTGKAEVVVRPGRVRSYAVFVVQGRPEKLLPSSPVRRMKL